MKILNINAWAIAGKRFNGISLREPLAQYDIESQHIIWEGELPEKHMHVFGGRFSCLLTRILRRIEKYFSIQSLLQINNPLRLLLKKIFYQSDIIHYHIIHIGYFSLLLLPILTRLKPSVWTLHDPWALTGHCIHPLDCEKWKTECNSCPMLQMPLAMKRDNTAFMFKLKRKIYQLSKIEIIVASQWMSNMVRQSPLLSHAKLHYIPFGLDLDFFKPMDCSEARKKLGIAQSAIVICFRACQDGFKGYEYIVAALEKLPHNHICLITFNQKGLFEKFQGKFCIKELGWCNDDVLLRDAFNASDIFLMPSIAESFGMMAIEAMACGKPVISFQGTALSEITFAPDAGVAVPMRDADALATAIQKLIEDPVERIQRGKRSRELVEKNYNIELQAKRMAKVYKDLLESNGHSS